MINNIEKNATAKAVYDDLIKKSKEEIIDICTSQMLVIFKREKEIERLNNIIKYTDICIDITIQIIKQQPSEDDAWILERLNGIKQCLKGSGKE